MTRPEVERIAAVYDRPGRQEHVPMIADLCRYVRAMEAAWEEIVNLDPDLGERFLAAVERWTP